MPLNEEFLQRKIIPLGVEILSNGVIFFLCMYTIDYGFNCIWSSLLHCIFVFCLKIICHRLCALQGQGCECVRLFIYCFGCSDSLWNFCYIFARGYWVQY